MWSKATKLSEVVSRKSTMKRPVVTLVVVLALAVSPWAIATAYVNTAGAVAEGTVIAKREAILLPGGDAWRHVFEVTYQYQPPDSPYPETASHQVDPALYSRLRVGSPVRVRYSPWRPLRFVKGWGSFLADSSAVSRLGYGSESARDFAEMAGIGCALLLAFVAYRAKSKLVALIAALLGAVSLPEVFLASLALLAFPKLFWGWRKKPGQGYGWLLFAIVVLSTPLIYWRIPQPAPMPPGPQRQATALVRHVRVVNEIWALAEGQGGQSYGGGQWIRQPFQMLDLEFTPEGTTDSIHALDRIDLGSVPGLRQDATLQISYSLSDPHVVRIAGATSTYVQAALLFILGLAYALAALVTFVAFPAMGLAQRFIGRFRTLASEIPPEAVKQQLSRLPPDDPRRKALEEFIRARQHQEQRNTPTGDGTPL